MKPGADLQGTPARGYSANRAPLWCGLILKGIAGNPAAGAVGYLQFERWRRANAHWLRRVRR